jgi:NADPH-dependent 2,4-dienoyl-CoA reductase/sulfur reductase-like enzyme
MSKDIVIVGAGPAGLACATTLAGVGIAVTLLDDNRQAGGQVWRTGPADKADTLNYRDPRGDEFRDKLKQAGDAIDYRPGHEIVAIDRDLQLWVNTGAGEVIALKPKALVLATGAVEIVAPVPGWTKPGVYGLGGLQLLMKSSRVVPTGPVVLAGAGPLLHLLAVQLAYLEANIVAVVDAAGWPTLGQIAGMATSPALLAKGLMYQWELMRRGIPILRRSMVVAINGAAAVEEVEIASVDDDWRPLGRARRVMPARVVGFGMGVRPNVELTGLAGCEHVYDDRRGGWHAKRNAALETTIANLFVAGDGGGINGVDAAIHEGTIVAAELAKRAGKSLDAATARAALATLKPFRESVAAWSNPRAGLFTAADADTMICRCEDVTRAKLDAALAAGYTKLAPLKMNTRAGMGLCQGRTCTPAIQHLCAARSGQTLAEIGLPTTRVPVRPVPLGAIGKLPADALP